MFLIMRICDRSSVLRLKYSPIKWGFFSVLFLSAAGQVLFLAYSHGQNQPRGCCLFEQKCFSVLTFMCHKEKRILSQLTQLSVYLMLLI